MAVAGYPAVEDGSVMADGPADIPVVDTEVAAMDILTTSSRNSRSS